MSSKVLQQLLSPPKNTTNLKATAASPSKPWLSPHMGEQQCSYTSGWASAPLVVLDRTGWSSAMNSGCLLFGVLLLWIQGLPRQALLLTSLASCGLAGTAFSGWQLTIHCLSPVWGEKMHHNRGPFVLYFAISTYVLHQNQKKQTSLINTVNRTALYKGFLNSPHLKPLWRFGMDSTDLAASHPLPLWHKVHLKSATTKKFQLLQTMLQGTGWW